MHVYADTFVSQVSDDLMEVGDSAAAGDKSTGRSISHKEAERGRRQRINSHLSTLRSILPSKTKTDKASVLAEVVHHVKELRKKAADVARQNTRIETEHVGLPLFPGEFNEASFTYDWDMVKLGSGFLRATLCCEDRPGLNRELSRVIRAFRARAVRAEMMTVGGRTKNVLVIKWTGGFDELTGLKRALKAVVDYRVPGHGSVQGGFSAAALVGLFNV